MPAYWNQDGDWIRRTGRRAGQPVGPWRSRRLDRKARARVDAMTGWNPPEDLDGGGAGVREPRAPRGPLPTLQAEADLPS